jgi:hypothetical protein
MIKKFFEYFLTSEDFAPIQSFYLQDDLNREIWDDKNDSLKPDIKKGLLKIAYDYLNYLEVEIELSDIIFVGSLSNYNWSKYSDFDVHLVFDFSSIDENIELVGKYLDTAEKLWKIQHDINIFGFPVELYCQDINHKLTATGVYSLLNDNWLIKPTKQNFVPDEDLIKEKSEKVMTSIDDIEKDYKNNMDYDALMLKLKKVWKKIKDARQAGLLKEGEFSIENLVFKLIRRNGYIQKIMDIRRNSYDRQFK